MKTIEKQAIHIMICLLLCFLSEQLFISVLQQNFDDYYGK